MRVRHPVDLAQPNQVTGRGQPACQTAGARVKLAPAPWPGSRLGGLRDGAIPETCPPGEGMHRQKHGLLASGHSCVEPEHSLTDVHAEGAEGEVAHADTVVEYDDDGAGNEGLLDLL